MNQLIQVFKAYLVGDKLKKTEIVRYTNPKTPLLCSDSNFFPFFPSETLKRTELTARLVCSLAFKTLTPHVSGYGNTWVHPKYVQLSSKCDTWTWMGVTMENGYVENFVKLSSRDFCLDTAGNKPFKLNPFCYDSRVMF